MAEKTKNTGKNDPKQIDTVARPGEDLGSTVARTMLCPSVQAAITIQEYSKGFVDLNLTKLREVLSEQTVLSRKGDMKRAEAMLMGQAHTLDAIFNTLAKRAIRAEYMDHLDRYLKLALRAQSQCRATWEALSTIKNPPVMGYVRQANIAHGPQQVNNDCNGQDDSPRAGEKPNVKNKLLEEDNGERLDFGTAGTPDRDDQAMATVGKINGAKERSR